MKKAILLLKPKALSIKNSMTKKAVLKRLPFIAMGAASFFLIYMAALTVLSYVRGIEFIGELISKRLFSMVFFSLTGFLILSNIITALSTFYLSRDTHFLASLPIGRQDILTFKTIETVIDSSWMTASFIPPVFIAYGAAYGAPFSYYVMTALCLTAFMLLNGGIGIAVAHILTRIFPARRLRAVMLFAGLVLFILAYFILRSSAPKVTNLEDLIAGLLGIDFDSPLLPGYWITEVLWGAASPGGWSLQPLYLMVLLSNALFFLMVSSAIGSFFYGRNMEERQSRETKKYTSHFYPGRLTALLYKDIRVFVRDMGQWSQLLIIAGLFLIYIYNFKAVPIDAFLEITPFVKEFIVFINILMSGLVLSAVAARFVYASVSMEGQAFWIIQSAPLGMERFLISKLLYGALPLTIIMPALVFFTNLAMGISGALMLISVSTVMMLSLSISGLGTGLGAVYPKFKYENIASVAMSLGGLSFMLLAFGLVLVTVGLEALPFYIYYKGALPLVGQWPAGGGGGGGKGALPLAAVSVMLILGINFLAFYLPLRTGIKKLRRLET